MQHIFINPDADRPPTRDLPRAVVMPDRLPPAKETKHHPSDGGNENASLFFVGTATTIMFVPNFLPAGDEAAFGAGVSSERRTHPAVELHDLPRIDLVLLSHYHKDHFDQKVEASLRRDLSIITTPHARVQLTNKDDSFTNVFALAPFETGMVEVAGTGGPKRPLVRVTGMPGKHVPCNAVVERLNKLAHAIPPTNGWMLELGTGADTSDPTDFTCGYRIYIAGDTLVSEELYAIPERFADQPIDLMLAHLGGTLIPSPALAPLAFMVSMDATQGVQMMRLIGADVTIPIHYDDYAVFASPVEDFAREVERAGLGGKMVLLERMESYAFRVREEVGRAREEETYFGGGGHYF
ncbi:uncharacterized protein N7482_000140 [Penicillium canariense]|uniref:Metallo-beta-lactamase domain-containing protein n=1 Tax=Penicillium canariense TaxID=189055 RepID=A0A9W9IAV4_9EURO|nr:uncharacterized protein N7482_000140 [Penicillium canariense]KAJ5174263.1 hypothetical protein N7482_000140 [Penicillium canariense]